MAEHRGFALALSYFTVVYNLLEGALSIGFATVSGSSALLGFGVDSFVESLSGFIMIWRFSGSRSVAEEERVESIAARLVGVSLLILGGYVAYEAVTTLYFGEPPERSLAGLLIAILSLVIMPILFLLKHREAKAIRSRSFAADAKQTLACSLLSVALLVGTGLHYLMGLWQADPAAGLLIAAFLAYEGYRAWTCLELC